MSRARNSPYLAQLPSILGGIARTLSGTCAASSLSANVVSYGNQEVPCQLKANRALFGPLRFTFNDCAALHRKEHEQIAPKAYAFMRKRIKLICHCGNNPMSYLNRLGKSCRQPFCEVTVLFGYSEGFIWGAQLHLFGRCEVLFDFLFICKGHVRLAHNERLAMRRQDHKLITLGRH